MEGIASSSATEPAEGEPATMDIDLEDESVYRERERGQLEKLVHPDIQNDVGCSLTGQYELIGTSLPLPLIPPPSTSG